MKNLDRQGSIGRSLAKLVRFAPAWIALAFFGSSDTAQAGFNAQSRFSEIAVQTSNLGGFGAGISDATLDPFSEVLVGSTDHVTPGQVILGGMNHGEWDVRQDSTVAPATVTVSMSQTASTGGVMIQNPIVGTSSNFELVFTVDQDTDVLLDGDTVGSTTIGSTNFVRVLMLDNLATLFSTSQGGTFPFSATLSPGRTYTFRVESVGDARGTTTVTSSADVTLSLAVAVPALGYPATLGLLVLLAISWIVIRRSGRLPPSAAHEV